MSQPPRSAASLPARRSERDLVHTLFELGRQVTSVLDVNALLRELPDLMARVTVFHAMAVYLLDEKRGELGIAYAEGYPDEAARGARFRPGEGLIGAAVSEGQPILVNDLRADTRYLEVVPDMRSELVVPLVTKARVIGAINLLSRDPDQFTEIDQEVLRQFAAHVAVGIENARLFDRERRDADAFETLAEIGREFASILDLDELLTRIAQLAKRVIDYRTFGIVLLDEVTGALEIKVAVKYGEKMQLPRLSLGHGLIGHAALVKQPILVPDVSKDPRYINLVEDVRSELVIPMLLKDRCLGVFDLESPELDAFSKRDVEILTVLASQAAVAIQNARLYEELAANEARLEKEVRFAQRVQAALMPTGMPKRLRGIEVAARFAAARELGGDFHDFLAPEPNTLVVAVGDVSGKGVPAALYGAFAGELVRGRTFRRRYAPERSTPAGVLTSINTILHQRQLEEYYCTLCYALFDFKKRSFVMSNSGLPYPVRCSGDTCAQIELPGVPLGSFAGSRYEEVMFPLQAGDLFVFCTDGVFEAMDADGREFSAARLLPVIGANRTRPVQAIVDAIFDAVAEHRKEAAPNDDMTVVALKITT
jgi:sigma-B regulation protein RsbU (phosphoserine phosphatase)